MGDVMLNGEQARMVGGTVSHEAPAGEASHRDSPLRSGRRLTIGMPVTSLGDSYTDALIRGVSDSAAAHDVNLLVYLLDGFDDLDEEVGAYALMGTARLDGLILTAGLAYRGERPYERLYAFLERWKGYPAVGVSLVLEDFPMVLPDSYVGMREAVEHLIEDHDYRRIAFITGPAGIEEAQDRYRAYADALAAHGIEVDDQLVAGGDYTEEGGEEAITTLLDRGGEFEALVCANDETAAGAFRVLQRRGVRVPDDLAVVGFDDGDSARGLSVPLTTVRQPVELIGHRAVESLLSLIEGGQRRSIAPLPPEIVVPTQLVTRRSCGCYRSGYGYSPAHPEEADAAEQQVAQRLVPYEAYRPEIIAVLEKVVEEVDVDSATGSIPLGKSLAELVDQFWQDLRHPEGTGFVAAISAQLQYAMTGAHGDELTVWHEILSGLQRMVVPLLGERRLWMRAEDLLRRARALVDESRLQLAARRQVQLERHQETMQAFSAQIAGLMDLESTKPLLMETLPALDVTTCYLSLVGEEDEADLRDARLAISYDRDAQRLAATQSAFRVTELVPQQIWRDHSEQYTAFVLPLTAGGESLGVVWFEGGLDYGGSTYRSGRHHRFDTFTWLRQTLSGLIFRARLAEAQRRARQAAEVASERAETALRDALIAQRRYVEGAWDAYREVLQGYYRWAGREEGRTRDAWLPVMSRAIRESRLVTTSDADGRQTLGVPLILLGDQVIGVLGFTTDGDGDEGDGRRRGGVSWSAEQIRIVENVVSQVAQALETQRLMSEVQRRAARLAASAEVSSAATAMTDLETLLPEAVDLIAERFDLSYAGIFLLDEGRDWAVLVAGTGDAGREMLLRGHRLKVGGQSMIGACASDGKARVTVDTAQEKVWRPNPLLPDIRSELALPLVSRAQVIGAMTIQDVQPGAFREEDVTTLQTLADQLANAIENARLLEQMNQNLRALHTATGALTETSWRDYVRRRQTGLGYRRRLLNVAQVYEQRPEAEAALIEGKPVILSLSGGDGPSSPADTVPHGDGAAIGDGGKRAASADQTDLAGARAGLGVPIQLRNQVLGVLNLRFEDDHVPPETVQLIEQVADRLAVSLETARLLEVTQRTAQRERMIGELTRRIRESLEVDEVLERSAREIREAMDLFRVAVRLAPAQGGPQREGPLDGGRISGEAHSEPPSGQEVES